MTKMVSERVYKTLPNAQITLPKLDPAHAAAFLALNSYKKK
jgi:hypothetical protein